MPYRQMGKPAAHVGLAVGPHARPRCWALFFLARSRPDLDCWRRRHHHSPGVGLRRGSTAASPAWSTDVLHAGLAEAPDALVEALAALEPETARHRAHGHPMRGAAMRAALHQLAAEFDQVAHPPHAKYEEHPLSASDGSAYAKP